MKSLLIVTLIMLVGCGAYAEQICPGIVTPGEFNMPDISIQNGPAPNLQGLDYETPETPTMNLEKELEMELIERNYIQKCA